MRKSGLAHMNIAILSIGDEILSGSTLNSNAHHIAGALAAEGYSVSAHMTVSDTRDAICSGLEHLFEMADCIISTGGLGPTCDDLTREIVADYFGMGMRFDDEVAASLKERFPGIDSLEDQATVPERAQALPNRTGTAPGLWFSERCGELILLPGVPSQMRQILSDEVIPLIKERFPLPERVWSRTLSFFQKRESEIDPLLRELKPAHPDVQFGIYPAYGTLGVKLTTRGGDDSSLNAPAAIIQQAFKENFFSDTDPRIEKALHERMIGAGKRLGLAESCTGGAFAARLTAIPDASRYFEGSVVSYSNAVKEAALDVAAETLNGEGAVSEQTVQEMAAGVHRMMDVDIAVAVSGVAGPGGGSEEKPVGTIWAAIQKRGERAQTFLIPTRAMWGRDLMISYSINYLIGEVIKRI